MVVKVGVVKSSVTVCIKKAHKIFSAECMNPVMQKRRRSHPELEKALTVYINDVTQYLRNESPFREVIALEMALNIPETMLSRLTERVAMFNDVENKDQILANAKQLQTFGASHGYYTRCFRGNGFTVHKGTRNAMHFDHILVPKARHDMKKEAAHYPLSCIMNTDEVAVQYTSLPSRSISPMGLFMSG